MEWVWRDYAGLQRVTCCTAVLSEFKFRGFRKRSLITQRSHLSTELGFSLLMPTAESEILT